MPYEIIEFAEMVRNVLLLGFVSVVLAFGILSAAVLAYWFADEVLSLVFVVVVSVAELFE